MSSRGCPGLKQCLCLLQQTCIPYTTNQPNPLEGAACEPTHQCLTHWPIVLLTGYCRGGGRKTWVNKTCLPSQWCCMGVPYHGITLYKANFEARACILLALGGKQPAACVCEKNPLHFVLCLRSALDMTMEKCFHVCVSGFNFLGFVRICSFCKKKQHIYSGGWG